MSESAETLLRAWIRRRISEPAATWLETKAAGGERDFLIAFAMVPKKLGKVPLGLGAGDLAGAEAACPGWRPGAWRVDQAARVLLVMGSAFPLDRLFANGSLEELVALHRGLALYPDAPAHLDRALEGARSNMVPVFEAVALDNPYPARWFPETGWNNMVLKALHLGSPLDGIQGLEGRATPRLMAMLGDYVRERRAAGRAVPTDLERWPEVLA